MKMEGGRQAGMVGFLERNLKNLKTLDVISDDAESAYQVIKQGGK